MESIVSETVLGISRDGDIFRKSVERTILTDEVENVIQMRVGGNRRRVWGTTSGTRETPVHKTMRTTVEIDPEEAQAYVEAAKDQNLIDLDQVNREFVSKRDWMIRFNYQ